MTSLALGVAASSSSTGGDEQTGGVVAITFPVLDCATVTIAFIGNVGLFGVDALLQSGLGANGTLFTGNNIVKNMAHILCLFLCFKTTLEAYIYLV